MNGYTYKIASMIKKLCYLSLTCLTLPWGLSLVQASSSLATFLVQEEQHAGKRMVAKARQRLLQAIASGKEDIVKKLLQEGIALDKWDEGAYQICMRAARNNHVAVVKLLLAHEKNPTIRPSWKQEALRYAATYGYKELAEAIIAAGFRIDIYRGLYFLYLAAESGHPALMNLLLAAMVNSSIGRSYTLSCETEVRYILKVRQHLKRQAYADSDLRRYNTWLLVVASHLGHPKLVRSLLADGADLEGCHGLPLRAAAKAGKLDVVKLLLTRGARENIGQALLDAARHHHLAIANTLLTYARASCQGAIEALFGEGNLHQNIDLLLMLLDHLDDHAFFANFMVCYANKDWETMLTLAALRPQLLKMVQSELVAYGEAKDSLTTPSPALRQLLPTSPKARKRLTATLRLMQQHIQEHNHNDALSLRDGMGSSSVGTVALVLAYLLLQYRRPDLSAEAFKKALSFHT